MRPTPPLPEGHPIFRKSYYELSPLEYSRAQNRNSTSLILDDSCQKT